MRAEPSEMSRFTCRFSVKTAQQKRDFYCAYAACGGAHPLTGLRHAPLDATPRPFQDTEPQKSAMRVLLFAVPAPALPPAGQALPWNGKVPGRSALTARHGR